MLQVIYLVTDACKTSHKLAIKNPTHDNQQLNHAAYSCSNLVKIQPWIR